MLLEYIIIFLLGLSPSVVWLTFFERQEREKPEPMSDLVFAFIVGALTTFVALFAQILLAKHFANVGVPLSSPFSVGIFATTEEIIKFLGLILLVSRKHVFDEPLDAMIYMITIGLGFASVENIASLINSGTIQQVFVSLQSFELLVLRFLGATLLHACASGIIGFHYGVGMIRKSTRLRYLLLGIVLASGLHSFFNILVMKYGPASWALAFVAVLAFFLLVDFEELRTEEERDGFV
jgi:RsiW-degrading membrane proteinase PrsW (M82 family)